jgi:hypothetical protein
VIIAKIYGGLGNQLFQYSFARKMALGLQAPLKLDVGFYQVQRLRRFQLDEFNICFEGFADSHDCRRITGSDNCDRNSPRHYFRARHRRPLVRENKGVYFSKAHQAVGDFVLDGYWQDLRYFQAIEPTIRKEITLVEQPRHAIWSEITENPNSVSVHIRRGDYVDMDRHLPMKYYDRAIEYMVKIVPEAVFYVFSDDISWCKQNVSGSKMYRFIDQHSLTDCQEMVLMSRCAHHICANSTFSWWGAYLNPGTSKIVLFPQSALNHLNKDLWLKEWKCIESG